MVTSMKKRLPICLFFLLLIVFGYKIYGSLSKSIWDGQNRLNLVFNPPAGGQPVLVASFNPEGKSVSILIIPNGTLIETIEGHGEYRVESLYRLGELENKGWELLSGSIQEYLGIPIDAYASISNLAPPAPRESKDFILASLRFLIGNGETNLTRWDLTRLWWGIKGVREDKINIINLEETGASVEVILPDGTKASKVDPQRLEQIASQFFVDEKIKKEDLTIVVLNATDQPGLANKGARLIRNIGGRVVGIGDTENEKCEIRSGKKHKNTYTVRKLSRIFNCRWEGEDLENQRAEIVLILW